MRRVQRLLNRFIRGENNETVNNLSFLRKSVNMSEIKAIVPAEEYVEMMKQVIEINKEIVRQNALIIQAITLPQLIIKGEQL